ncbi:MAG: TlpA family protein disulfide reductase [Bacteroidales bacterium]|nr:TlpA family protein disulfide reductase [Bacteroidales bacterium]
MKTKLLLAALGLATTAFGQNNKTAIEFNLTDIPEGYIIDISKFEGQGGRTCFADSSTTTTRKFTVNCEDLTDNTYYAASLYKKNNNFSHLNSRKIMIQKGSTTYVSGSGIHSGDWNVESKNPKQVFLNKMNDLGKDLLSKMDDIRDTVTNYEGYRSSYPSVIEIYDQVNKREFEAMKTIPVDAYWLERLLQASASVNYEGKEYKYYNQVEELYKLMPDQYKNTKEGKAINLALYSKAPEIGDVINDYDLYDADGNVHHLADYRGKWLLLEFSSYFCGPCRLFCPTVKYFYERGVGKNFEIIDITNDAQVQFEAMAADEKFTSPLFNDRESKTGLFALNKISAYPTFYIVDPEGKITDIFMGVYYDKIIKLMKDHGGFAKPEYKKEKNATIITRPEFANINGQFLIDKIEIYKDSVVTHCTFPISYTSYKVAKETGLFINGKCVSKLIGSNISNDDFTPIPFGELGHCRLTFDPLPKGTKSFDFIEGDCDGCFKIEGIKIAE